MVEKLGELFQLQIYYIQTAGHHSVCMPCFLDSTCISKSSSGEVEYSLGPDAHFKDIRELPNMPNLRSRKRTIHSTPQHGARRKRQNQTSTPKKVEFTKICPVIHRCWYCKLKSFDDGRVCTYRGLSARLF